MVMLILDISKMDDWFFRFYSVVLGAVEVFVVFNINEGLFLKYFCI